MKRLTEYMIPETGFSVVSEEKYKRILMEEKPSVEKVYNRLKKIEDILGDKYDLDRLRELAQADREGRVKILPKSKKRTCGDCKRFNRTPGKRSGTCSVREWYADRYGNIDIRRGIFTPNQSRLACKQYIARDGAAGAALEGMKNG